MKLINSLFHISFINKTNNLKYDTYKYRLEINFNVHFAIASFGERTIFTLIGFGSQSTVIEAAIKRAVEYMVLCANIAVH